MNLDQLRYVCAIYETGSINRAAEKLYLSQPNVSNAITRLEHELGFAIMHRSHQGVTFTQEGIALVNYASRILDDCNAIRSLHAQPQRRRFRLISPHYPPVDRAFILLCQQLEKNGELCGCDLHLLGGNWVESLAALQKKTVELAVACVPQETVHSAIFRSSLEQHGVQFVPIAQTSVVIKLSKDHPLLRETPFPFARLSEYPMTEYTSRVDTLSAYGSIKLPAALQPSHIYVDSGRTRTQLIAGTTVWGLAMKLPKQHETEYGVRYVELPDSTWCIGVLREASRPEDELEMLFLELLREQLRFLYESGEMAEEAENLTAD